MKPGVDQEKFPDSLNVNLSYLSFSVSRGSSNSGVNTRQMIKQRKCSHIEVKQFRGLNSSAKTNQQNAGTSQISMLRVQMESA